MELEVKPFPGSTPYFAVTNAGSILALDDRFSHIQIIVTTGNVYIRFGDHHMVAGDVIVSGASGSSRDFFMINSSSEEFSITGYEKVAFRTIAGDTATVHVNYVA
jgi:hypothetical protein